VDISLWFIASVLWFAMESDDDVAKVEGAGGALTNVPLLLL